MKGSTRAPSIDSLHIADATMERMAQCSPRAQRIVLASMIDSILEMTAEAVLDRRVWVKDGRLACTHYGEVWSRAFDGEDFGGYGELRNPSSDDHAAIATLGKIAYCLLRGDHPGNVGMTKEES